MCIKILRRLFSSHFGFVALSLLCIISVKYVHYNINDKYSQREDQIKEEKFYTIQIRNESMFSNITNTMTIRNTSSSPIIDYEDNITLLNGGYTNDTKCSLISSGSMGSYKINTEELNMKEIEKKYEEVGKGGEWNPQDCIANHKIAMIIPYRDRDVHLRILLNNMHHFLKKQKLHYRILVVEQIANQTFNRAKLMNVGFIESMKISNWSCHIFHDVDLLPENYDNMYICSSSPKHMSVAMNKFHYKMPYSKFFGGVTAFTSSQYKKINGMSNNYWGWGGEDDDLYNRVIWSGLKIYRNPLSISKYVMVKHNHDEGNPINQCRQSLLNKSKIRWKSDGLNSLYYQLISIEEKHLYTHIIVDLLEEKEKYKGKRKC